MVELGTIADALRRQRKDLEELADRTSSRRGETAELVGKIEDLQRRAEATQRRFAVTVNASKSKPTK